MIEHGDRVGDVGIDVARAGERARLEAALLGQDTVDQAVELLDEADEVLRTDARPAMEQQRRRTLALTAPGPKISPPGTATVRLVNPIDASMRNTRRRWARYPTLPMKLSNWPPSRRVGDPAADRDLGGPLRRASGVTMGGPWTIDR